MRTLRPALRPGALAAGLVLLLGTPAGAQSDILLQLESGNPASSRFVVDSGGGFVARGTFERGTIPATGDGVRLMWYPRRAAFRAGYADGTRWDDVNVAPYSIGTGYNSTANGYYSTAMGRETTASGLASTAMGDATTATGSYSTAMGRNNFADGSHSTVMGGGTLASGYGSTAMGIATAAAGNYSTAMGLSTIASGQYSTAMGGSTTAGGQWSTAMGYSTAASGDHSTAMGSSTVASGVHSTAMGRMASTHGQVGSFVYGDASTPDTVRASAAHQATWRTTGGFRIFTNTALTTGCNIAAGGTDWSCTSSRLEKENFAAVDGEDVLRRLRSVPVTSWNGIAEGPQVRHIGPMAQDWHAAFALNDDPLTIHQGDLAGVSLAAVQALDGRTRGVPELQREVARLRQENAALRSETAALRTGNTDLEARLARLEALVGGTP
jgi:trimeric autotransporter adhesin